MTLLLGDDGVEDKVFGALIHKSVFLALFAVVAGSRGEDLFPSVQNGSAGAGEDKDDLGGGVMGVQPDGAARLQPAFHKAVQLVGKHAGVGVALAALEVVHRGLGHGVEVDHGAFLAFDVLWKQYSMDAFSFQ